MEMPLTRRFFACSFAFFRVIALLSVCVITNTSIFFAVELGALATVPVIMFLFHKHREPVNAAVETAVTDYFPTFLLLANIVLLITASFIPGKPAPTNGFICTGLFLVGAVQSLIRGRGATAPAQKPRCLRLTIKRFACLPACSL